MQQAFGVVAEMQQPLAEMLASSASSGAAEQKRPGGFAANVVLQM